MFWVREVKRCSAARIRSLKEVPAGVPVAAAVVVDPDDADDADVADVAFEAAREGVVEAGEDVESACCETKAEAGNGDGGAEAMVR